MVLEGRLHAEKMKDKNPPPKNKTRIKPAINKKKT
jgi:hypothetical protein